MAVHVIEKEEVILRIAGDSGDGIQLLGGEFSESAAYSGNDIETSSDFPAEIRAPHGSSAGVSGYQLRLAAKIIHTPGSSVDALVALNPAALFSNLKDVKDSGVLIINEDSFTPRGFKLAGNKREEMHGVIAKATLQLFEVPMTTLTRKALDSQPDIVEQSLKTKDRAKNFFALGLLLWLYGKKLEHSENFIADRFRGEGKQLLRKMNGIALKAGYAYGDASELFLTRYVVPSAGLPAGEYRSLSGNQAVALGLLSGAHALNMRPVFASYPITPSSDIFNEFVKLREHGVTTVQAEDETAAIGMALGASYAGCLGLSATSGPGFVLKMEFINLAVMAELPLVIVDVQRSGPSTGMPTKSEQTDLLQALYGRNGESPLPVLAASSPGDAYRRCIEAVKLSVKYRVPVIVLSEGALAHATEPWRIPQISDIQKAEPNFARLETKEKTESKFDEAAEAGGLSKRDDERGAHWPDKRPHWPYKRDEKSLARNWAIPGQAGMEHQIGGLEKENIRGGVSYDDENHDTMVRLRAAKVAAMAADIPPLQVLGKQKNSCLVLGWGSTAGAIFSAVETLEERNPKLSAHLSRAHLHHLNPFPPNMASLLADFSYIFIPEMNLGQLAMLLRGHFGLSQEKVCSYTKVSGKPLRSSELAGAMETFLESRKF